MLNNQKYRRHLDLESLLMINLVTFIISKEPKERNATETIMKIKDVETKMIDHVDSFIHSGHFYSAPSSPLLLRGAPDYSTDTISEFHAEAHRQLQVKDLPKVPT